MFERPCRREGAEVSTGRRSQTRYDLMFQTLSWIKIRGGFRAHVEGATLPVVQTQLFKSAVLSLKA